MPPSRRRRRRRRSILNNHASILSAPPILPIYPKQPCLHPVGAADPSQLSRTITSAPPSRLLPCYNSKTHSPFGNGILHSLRPSGTLFPSFAAVRLHPLTITSCT